MSVWIWVPTRVAIETHREQLIEHGGGQGVRDIGLLENAISRPQHLAAYGDPDIAALTAAYAYGIARNHLFVDGNKRTAAVVSEIFALRNGHMVRASDAEVVVAFQALAAGDFNEEELADWFRERLVRRD